MNFLVILLITIYVSKILNLKESRSDFFQFRMKTAKVNSQIEEVDTRPIGPVAQIVHNAYNTISCSQHAWQSFFQDAQSKISDVSFELNFRFTDFRQYFNLFRRKSRGLSYNRQRIQTFYDSTISGVENVRRNLKNLNDTLNAIDAHVQFSIDRLTRDTYNKSISAIWTSIALKKSCTPTIIEAQREIFNVLDEGIRKCSDKPINFEVDFQLSSGFRIPTEIFVNLNGCLDRVDSKSNATAIRLAEKCIKSVWELWKPSF